MLKSLQNFEVSPLKKLEKTIDNKRIIQNLNIIATFAAVTNHFEFLPYHLLANNLSIRNDEHLPESIIE